MYKNDPVSGRVKLSQASQVILALFTLRERLIICVYSSIWNHKYDFRPKLHDTRFNYHFITSILKSPKYRTWSVQTFYWCSTEPVWKFIHLLGGKSKSFGNKSWKICQMILFVFRFSAIWSVTLNKPWNRIGRFVFSVASSLPGKKMRFKSKHSAIRG